MHLSEAAAAAPIPRGYVPSPREQQILDLREDGLSAAKIGERLGLKQSSVFTILARLRQKGGHVVPSSAPTGRPLGQAAADEIEVPTWVPPEIRADYRRIAADVGEEEAARWARQIKNGDVETTPTLAPVSDTAGTLSWWDRKDRIDALRRLVGEGLSAGAIAERLETSRNAVIGKASRLGLTFGPKRVAAPPRTEADWWTVARVDTLRKLALSGTTGPTIAAQLGTTAQKVREKARALKITLKLAKPGLSPVPAVRQAAAEIARAAAPTPRGPGSPPADSGAGHTTSLAAAPADAITIHELVGARCHWPFGDLRESSFRYCGAPMADKDDPLCRYCARHREIAGAGLGRGR